jgi:hypothetical protein
MQPLAGSTRAMDSICTQALKRHKLHTVKVVCRRTVHRPVLIQQKQRSRVRYPFEICSAARPTTTSEHHKGSLQASRQLVKTYSKGIRNQQAEMAALYPHTRAASLTPSRTLPKVRALPLMYTRRCLIKLYTVTVCLIDQMRFLFVIGAAVAGAGRMHGSLTFFVQRCTCD